MKRKPFLWLLLCLIAIPAYCADKAKPVTITFYHTSDIHEHSGNLEKIAGYIEQQRKKGGNVILVDSGDWCNKGDLTKLNTRGEAIVEMLGACRYDAMIPGNHDFSFGPKRLAELIDKYKLPVVAANCTWPSGAVPKNVKPYRIIARQGVRVAIIGSITLVMGTEMNKKMQITPIAESAKKAIAEIGDKADIFVLLTHIGPKDDQKIITAVPRLDIIFGGHHHKLFDEVNFNTKTRTALQHSSFYGELFTEMTVTWDGKKLTDHTLRIIDVTNDMKPSPAVKAIADKYRSKR